MRPLQRLLPLFRPYRLLFIVVLSSTVGMTLMNLATPWLIRSSIEVVSSPLKSNGWQHLLLLSGLLAAAFLVSAVCRFGYMYLSHKMAYRFVDDLRVHLYKHLQNLSARFFADRQTGDVLKRVISDTRDLEPLVAHYVPDMTANFILLIGVGAILFYLNPVLALLTCFPMPLLLFGNLFFGQKIRSALRQSSGRLGSLSGVIHDNIVGIKDIQLFTREAQESERIHQASNEVTRLHLQGLKRQSILAPAIEYLTTLGTVVTILFGGLAILNQQMAVKDLVAFVLYLGFFYQPATQMAQMNEFLQVALTAAGHIDEVLKIGPDVDEAPDAKDPGRLVGHISFEHVSFAYTDETPTIQDVSFTVQPGQVLALVGATGAGKTTIASLIPRFYDPIQGRILIHGQDIRTMTIRGLRSNISMVMQDVFLFNGSIRENIRYSKLDARSDEIVRAARVAQAHDFIMELPDGYDTLIGERGIKLSGGQKQRLAIARAVLRDAPILILDEATSAVDSETEAEIQTALNKLMQGRTSIVIAHRLSTIRNADQILVLDHGQIVEQGYHEALLRQSGGRYKRLYEAHSRA